MKKAIATAVLAGLLVVGNVTAAEAANHPKRVTSPSLSISRVGAFGLGCGTKMHPIVVNGITYCVPNVYRTR